MPQTPAISENTLHTDSKAATIASMTEVYAVIRNAASSEEHLKRTANPDRVTVILDFYCPMCGHECVVSSAYSRATFHESEILETCECSRCGGVMLVGGESHGREH